MKMRSECYGMGASVDFSGMSRIVHFIHSFSNLIWFHFHITLDKIRTKPIFPFFTVNKSSGKHFQSVKSDFALRNIVYFLNCIIMKNIAVTGEKTNFQKLRDTVQF